MNFNILVIDDEFETRKKCYKDFALEITRIHSSFKISFDFLEQPDRSILRAKLDQNQYAAVITDAVLNGKWKDFTIADVMEIIDDVTPVAIVSKRWDDTNAKQIARAWGKLNCRTFLHWRDISCTDGGQIEYAVESVLRMITDQKKLDINTQLEPNDDIRIVHISDVHTDGVESDRVLHMAQGCAHAILKHWKNRKPTFVVFTGDVTEYGAPTQYKWAKKWIAHFFRHLGLGKIPARNLFYVPGNHDVNLCLTAASRVSLSEGETQEKLEMSLDDEIGQPDLLQYAYVPFRDFLTELTDCPLLKKDINEHNFAWVEARFRHLGVVFYGINTAQPASAFGLPERKVDVGVLDKLEEELGNILVESIGQAPLVIGLGHHSPVAEAEDGAVTNLDDFRRFFQGKGKTQMFLHGHCHKSILTDEKINDERIFRSGAPSFTKSNQDRPEDTLRGFNLLTLHRSEHVVTSLDACSFGWFDGKVKDMEKYSYELREGNFWEVRIAPKV